MKSIKKYPKNKISLDELKEFYNINEYTELAKYVKELIERGDISGIKNSGHNGKKPRLFNAYKIKKEVIEYKDFLEEIKYFVPEINMDYYVKHLSVYLQDREYILMINKFIKDNNVELKKSVSINERSFEIFGHEKFILKLGGNRILKNLKLSISDLNCYETKEPLAYYSHNKKEGQNIVIVENKDTFFTMRKHLIERSDEIFGVKVGTIIYGSGKAIYGSIGDFEICIEPYMKAAQNKILYFGDIDYEGLLIYEKVRTILEEKYKVRPFIKAYIKMLDKAKNIRLPVSKEFQNQNCGDDFFEYFDKKSIEQIKDVLKKGEYIPQEIIQIYDL